MSTIRRKSKTINQVQFELDNEKLKNSHLNSNYESKDATYIQLKKIHQDELTEAAKHGAHFQQTITKCTITTSIN